MSWISRLKLSTQVWLISATLLLLFSLVGIHNFLEMRTLGDFTYKMYYHPFAVSNTAKDVKLGIVRIHRSMKDVALAKNLGQINAAALKVDEYEKGVFKSFDFIEERFLGDKSKFLLARESFAKWRDIRGKVINFAKE